MIGSQIRRLVWLRADDRCEYCRLPEAWSEIPHQVEHVIARQQGGSDDLDNLALSCARCNLHKGPNISGLDPLSRSLTPLFDPRREVWRDHFKFRGASIGGLTPIGRTTVVVLAMNSQRRLEQRTNLIAQGEVF